ncbi:unnamed protein product [Sphenostylis stenocarpa]|uniref:BHLH domain-containing protein n=1 Tax=Sphenostylis stenocarpa TaxID=92480 RepID=A0AA86VMA9_9FABA|nr:unnamed protein product [Sphenostylis stenocarpa]
MDYTHPTSSAGSSSKTKGSKEKKGAKKCKGVRLSTDPQSVAARERRHRISDRFKILQSMVPGGSKMDTVSMLEEAIQYVKYLKAQIWLHQTMINFLDDNESLFPMYLSDCYFPSEQFIPPQQNPPLDHDNMQNLPHLPQAQCSFQGEDATYFDASLKYWPA